MTKQTTKKRAVGVVAERTIATGDCWKIDTNQQGARITFKPDDSWTAHECAKSGSMYWEVRYKGKAEHKAVSCNVALKVLLHLWRERAAK